MPYRLLVVLLLAACGGDEPQPVCHKELRYPAECEECAAREAPDCDACSELVSPDTSIQVSCVMHSCPIACEAECFRAERTPRDICVVES